MKDYSQDSKDLLIRFRVIKELIFATYKKNGLLDQKNIWMKKSG